MTHRHHIIDLTLLSLDVGKLAKPTSKVSCEVYYGDGDTHLRLKLQPSIKNGVALFSGERVRIPYSTEVTLLFKMFVAKKTDYLGQCTLSIEKCLREGGLDVKLKEKLEERNVWVDLKLKIIDKQQSGNEECDDLEGKSFLPVDQKQGDEKEKPKTYCEDSTLISDDLPFVVIQNGKSITTPLLL
jgi:hypothetical protein